MSKYRMEPIFIPSMGSISAMDITETRSESKEKQALWQINSMRRHDGLEPFKRLPKGIEFTYVDE